MSKKAVLFALAVIGLLGALGMKYYNQKHQAPFYYAGTIEATKVDVPARLPTVISKVHATEGSKVTKGQNLVSLECDDLNIQRKLANESYDRGQQLVNVGSMARETFDQLQTRKEDLDLKLSWCNVQSPVNGTVMSRFHEPGEWVAAGSKLLSLADLEHVWAYVYVAQPMLADLKIGAEVDSFLPEIGMKRIKGQIAKINDEAEFTPKNVQTREERTRLVYGVKIQFDNSDGLLKPGMPIEVDLTRASNE